MTKIKVKPVISVISRSLSTNKSQQRRRPDYFSEAVGLSSVHSRPPLCTNMPKTQKSNTVFTTISEGPPLVQMGAEKSSSPFLADTNVQTLWHSFRSNTTMHGLKYATETSNYKLRGVIWILALLCMGGMLIYTCFDLFNKYIQHTTLSNIKVELVNELPFPAITFCNLSPYKKSALRPDAAMEHYLLTVSRMTHFAPPVDYDNPVYSNLSLPLPDGWINNVSFSVVDMFYACVDTQNIMLNCSKVLMPTLTDIGLCFTFNSEQYIRSHGPLVMSITGSAKSMAFYLHVDQDEYVYNDNIAAGMKIIVHDPSEEPDTNQGFYASPGFSVYASLTLTKYKYLPSPYKSAGGRYCLDTGVAGFRSPLSYHDMYSRNACIKECTYRYLVRMCGCQAPTDTGPERTCTFREYAECYRLQSRGEYLQNATFQESCQCDIPCEFNVYGASVSSGYFPSKLNEQFLNAAGFSNLRRDYMEVRFFFDTLSYLNVEYMAEYNVEKLMATLGGQMGIFLGASLLTLSELAEFLVMAALVCCKSIRNSRPK